MPVLVRDPIDPRISHWHWVAYQIRWLREKHGLSLTQVGQILDLTRSSISSFEAARRRLDMDYAKLLDERYGTDVLIQTIVFYAQMAHDPDWHRTFLGYEKKADTIKIYHGQRIPIPFQTEGVIRALVSASRKITDIEKAVQSRLSRQESLLEREDPPFVWALLDENVLDWQAGGAEVFRMQLAHLHELSKRPNIGVRVIPKSAGVHLGADGAFQIVTYENRAAAYAGARHGGRVIESPMDVREFVLDWECMSQMALSDDLSRAKISEKLEALG